jgi:methionyl aminopeptidase
MTSVKAPYEIEAMRVGGKMLASVLDHLQKELSPGMTTKDLAEIAKRELRTMGGQPAFLGYQGFPDVLCVSLNNEVVHGIPSAKRVIEEGDIVSLDFGVRYKGMITDGAISAVAGRATNPKVGKLIETIRH